MKYLYLFLMATICQVSFAQTKKSFITNDGGFTSDPKNAASYILIQKLAGDSAYMVKHYDMRDTILVSGFYKDESLTIPNGKFIYYAKISMSKDEKQAAINNVLYANVDTNNFIKDVGYYVNGKRTGLWIDYASRGVKRSEITYDNGKENGPYKLYVINRGGWSEGTMVDDSLDGKFYNYNGDSILVSELDMVHGHMVNEINHFHEAQQPDGFTEYLMRKLHKYYTQLTENDPTIQFLVDKTGAIKNPKMINGINPQIDSAILAVIVKAPAYIPATYDGSPVNQTIIKPLNVYHTLRDYSSRPIKIITHYIGTDIYRSTGSGGVTSNHIGN